MHPSSAVPSETQACSLQLNSQAAQVKHVHKHTESGLEKGAIIIPMVDMWVKSNLYYSQGWVIQPTLSFAIYDRPPHRPHYYKGVIWCWKGKRFNNSSDPTVNIFPQLPGDALCVSWYVSDGDEMVMSCLEITMYDVNRTPFTQKLYLMIKACHDFVMWIYFTKKRFKSHISAKLNTLALFSGCGLLIFRFQWADVRWWINVYFLHRPQILKDFKCAV